MSDKNLDLVKKLLTRAGHPQTPDEEARTCAVKAARMMTEHGFVAIDPNANGAARANPEAEAAYRAAQRAAHTATSTAAAAAQAHDAYTSQITDIFDGRGQRPAPSASASAAPAAARPRAVPKDEAAEIMDIFERQQPRRARGHAPATMEPIVMPSRFDGFCRACARRYSQGEEVAVVPGRGACHSACKAYWDASGNR